MPSFGMDGPGVGCSSSEIAIIGQEREEEEEDERIHTAGWEV